MRTLLPLILLAACAAPADGPDDTDDTDAPAERPAWQAPDTEGPYEVGATTLRLAVDGGGSLAVEVWYPAVPPEGAEPGRYEEGILGFDGQAFRDAPPDPRGPWPVVAFSHGFGGIRFQSFFLTEHLARHGVVVVAPDHAGTNLGDFDPDRAAASAALRPSEVAAAVDALSSPGVPGLDVDLDAYVAVGHSFGAWTSLVVAGGQLDLPGFEAVCAAEGAPRGCRFFEGQSFDDLDLSRAVPDPRAVGAVALTPGVWYAFGADGAGLATVRAPLVLGGTLDGELPFEPETTGTYAALGAPKALGTVLRSGHWAFSDLCELIPYADCAGEAKGYLEPARVHEVVRAVTLAHVGVTLLGDDRYAPWLAAQDDLDWESEP